MLRLPALGLFLLSVVSAQNPGIITTVAGTGVFGYNADNIPAVQAQLDLSVGGATFGGEILYDYAHIAFDAAGNLYIPDKGNNRIRRVAASGIITTVAGTGEHGFRGNNVPALEAVLDYPTSVAFDRDGNLYFADQHNNRVRRVVNGIISTYAGNGDFNFGGNGGPAARAALAGPGGIAFDAEGNLYISDTWNNQIRRVTPGGIITAYAGSGEHSYGGDGGPAVFAALDFPAGLAIGPDGALYFADQHNNRIRRVSREGVITTVAGSGTRGFGGDGGPAAQALLNYPTDVAFDSEGRLYIADQENNRIRRVGLDGIISTVVGNGFHGYGGDGGPPLEAALDFPSGITFDNAGALYIVDHHNHRIRKVVFNPPALAASPSALAFAAIAGAPAPAAQTITLTNPGTGSVAYTISPSQPWLEAAPASGSVAAGTPVTVSVRVNLANLAPGEHSGTITIQGAGAANSPQTVRVSLTVRPAAASPPVLSAGGVVNAASFAAGPIAPGQIVSIFGSNLGPTTGLESNLDPATGRLATNRGGVTVLFNEIAGALFFVSRDQINVQVPYELAGQASARIVVRYLDLSSAPATVPLVPAAPGIFTATGTGRGQAALLNQDFTVNSASNPARRESVVVIYLTGQGPTNPPAVTGQLTVPPFPSPALAVQVTIGGRDARTLFAGLAPGYAGLLQINAVIPEGVAAGDNVALAVTVGEAASQAGVTLAVQ